MKQPIGRSNARRFTGFPSGPRMLACLCILESGMPFQDAGCRVKQTGFCEFLSLNNDQQCQTVARNTSWPSEVRLHVYYYIIHRYREIMSARRSCDKNWHTLVFREHRGLGILIDTLFYINKLFGKRNWLVCHACDIGSTRLG